MISRELALALRDAGLVWHPESGDRFQLDLPDDVEAEAEADVFTVSEMTIEARRYPDRHDPRVQRHDRVGARLGRVRRRRVAAARGPVARAAARRRSARCTRLEDAFEVEVELGGERMRFEHPDVAEAYGLALLELIGRSR